MALAPHPEALSAAFVHCDQAVREGDKDRWLASLFAPEALRPDLLALYAFNLEASSVRERIREALPGEVRLQWWRDVLEGAGRGDVQSHPVAAAILDVIARHHLPVAPLIALIDARVADLYDDLFPTIGDFEGYCGETSSVLMQMAALILAEGDDPLSADLAGHAGIAYAATGMLRSFALRAAEGRVQWPAEMLAARSVTREDIVAHQNPDAVRKLWADVIVLARQHLAAAEAGLASADRRTLAAFVGLATVGPRLDRLGKQSDPYAPVADLPQWRRQWAMWRWARRWTRR
jgi:phytoene synthase